EATPPPATSHSTAKACESPIAWEDQMQAQLLTHVWCNGPDKTDSTIGRGKI
ncbi:11708_t:CDS:1, partial [Dentiscutata erythropus]